MIPFKKDILYLFKYEYSKKLQKAFLRYIYGILDNNHELNSTRITPSTIFE